MTDLLLRIGVSNLCVSLAIAVAAWVIQTTCKRPRIAHLLWLLALVKLVTPPVVTVPVLAVPAETVTTAESRTVSPGPGPAANFTAAPDPDRVGTGASSLSPVPSPWIERGKDPALYDGGNDLAENDRDAG